LYPPPPFLVILLMVFPFLFNKKPLPLFLSPFRSPRVWCPHFFPPPPPILLFLFWFSPTTKTTPVCYFVGPLFRCFSTHQGDCLFCYCQGDFFCFPRYRVDVGTPFFPIPASFFPPPPRFFEFLPCRFFLARSGNSFCSSLPPVCHHFFFFDFLGETPVVNTIFSTPFSCGLWHISSSCLPFFHWSCLSLTKTFSCFPPLFWSLLSPPYAGLFF